jgi:hypothetical protein
MKTTPLYASTRKSKMMKFDTHTTLQNTPRVLPLGWRDINANTWENRGLGLFISFTGEIDDCGNRWLHVCVSKKKEVPNWSELKRCKEIFLGDRKAILVFPPKAEYVNICSTALHLFAALDGDRLPDFRNEFGL